jgi:hypothetical protein
LYETVEVTPRSIRLRKKVLSAQGRRQIEGKKKKAKNWNFTALQPASPAWRSSRRSYEQWADEPEVGFGGKLHKPAMVPGLNDKKMVTVAVRIKRQQNMPLALLVSDDFGQGCICGILFGEGHLFKFRRIAQVLGCPSYAAHQADHSSGDSRKAARSSIFFLKYIPVHIRASVTMR